MAKNPSSLSHRDPHDSVLKWRPQKNDEFGPLSVKKRQKHRKNRDV